MKLIVSVVLSVAAFFVTGLGLGMRMAAPAPAVPCDFNFLGQPPASKKKYQTVVPLTHPLSKPACSDQFIETQADWGETHRHCLKLHLTIN
jgi:hypothetical protein